MGKILVVLAIRFSGCPAADSLPASPTPIPVIPKLMDHSKAGIMAYLADAIKYSLWWWSNTVKTVTERQKAIKAYVENLYKQSGKYLALVAVEYGYSPNGSWTGANVAIPDNLNYQALMKHPAAITRDEL